jgi:hypothetical protein
MLYSTTAPEQKHLKLIELLASGTVQQFPAVLKEPWRRPSSKASPI